MTAHSLPLEDIILPPAIGFWPLAWGWWLVIIGCILCSAGLVWLIWRLYSAKQRQTTAFLALQQSTEHLAGSALLSAVNTWLKLHAHPETKQTAQSLYGQAWLDYLNSSAGSAVFTPEQEHALSAGIYQAQPLSIDKAALLESAQQWWRLSRTAREAS